MGTIEAKSPAHATNRGLRIFNAIALLKPGVTVQQAQAEIAAQSETLARTYPATNQGVAITLEPLYERIVGNARPGLRVLFVTVALLLLIACANVANLMLARTTTRERELAIRAALGAGKGRLVRQVLTESLVLAVAGGALGLLVATWGVDALPAMLSGAVAPCRSDSRRRDRHALRDGGDAGDGRLLRTGAGAARGSRTDGHSQGGRAGRLLAAHADGAYVTRLP